MAKKKAASDGGVRDLAALGLESYVVEKLPRSRLINAEYNPRTITADAKRKLRDGLKRHGIVTPPVWNRRTGNIVGGHQRLAALDALAGSANYSLHVAVIDVDEQREKELNILLNNPEAQGGWDIEKLGAMIPTLDLAGTGFDEADVYQIFGDKMTLAQDSAAIEDLAEQLSKLRESFTKIGASGAQSDNDEFYIVVVFRNPEECSSFLEKGKLPDNRYQSGRAVAALCRIEL